MSEKTSKLVATYTTYEIINRTDIAEALEEATTTAVKVRSVSDTNSPDSLRDIHADQRLNIDDFPCLLTVYRFLSRSVVEVKIANLNEADLICTPLMKARSPCVGGQT